MTFEELIVKQALEIEDLKEQIEDFTKKLDEAMAIPAAFLCNNQAMSDRAILKRESRSK